MEEQTMASEADGTANLMLDPSQQQIDFSAPAIEADDELAVVADRAAAETEVPLETGKAEKAVPEEHIRKTEPAAEPEKLRITSSLGGSARELLNEDGTQR